MEKDVRVSEILSRQDALFFLDESERILGKDFEMAPEDLRKTLQEAKQKSAERSARQEKECLEWLRNAIISSR